ncbi:hypothetical protein WN51_14041 [Melipona quadrifasciata]|uniref:Uncharacterized protein n=1 Tax=Melipona quadrifasciata TaxID=166423 RepID=A0A0M9A1G8_9HYME|nr:hypothetical protein WN51_14041 [Melipona quadrifasciata]
MQTFESIENKLQAPDNATRTRAGDSTISEAAEQISSFKNSEFPRADIHRGGSGLIFSGGEEGTTLWMKSQPDVAVAVGTAFNVASVVVKFSRRRGSGVSREIVALPVTTRAIVGIDGIKISSYEIAQLVEHETIRVILRVNAPCDCQNEITKIPTSLLINEVINVIFLKLRSEITNDGKITRKYTNTSVRNVASQLSDTLFECRSKANEIEAGLYHEKEKVIAGDGSEVMDAGRICGSEWEKEKKGECVSSRSHCLESSVGALIAATLYHRCLCSYQLDLSVHASWRWHLHWNLYCERVGTKNDDILILV